MDLSDEGGLVLEFVNTVDVEEGTDALTTPAGLAAWVHGLDALRGLAPEPFEATGDDLALARDLRAGLREVLGAPVGVPPDAGAVDAANAALRRLPLHVALPTSAPAAPGAALVVDDTVAPARRALAAVAVAWTRLVVVGESTRLRRCPESSCGWCFWDHTKARNRRWCSMRVCGNRAKTRAYAARQRARATGDG